MSLALPAPDAEHDLRLPQIAVGLSAPLPVRLETLMEDIAEADEIMANDPQPNDLPITAANDDVPAETDIGTTRVVEEDFSEIQEDDPSETDRERLFRQRGPQFPDVDVDAATFHEDHEDTPLETIQDEGFRPYQEAPTDKKSYLLIDVQQTMSFFQRSLLDYLRLTFWLLNTTATLESFARVFDGFKNWYQQKLNYFQIGEWQNAHADSAVFKTAGNARSTEFDAHRAKIKAFLDSNSTDPLSPTNPDLPAGSSHCEAMVVLAGEVIRSAQMLHNIFKEIADPDVTKYMVMLARVTECVKFIEFNRKFVALENTGVDAFQLKPDAVAGWPGLFKLFFDRMEMLNAMQAGNLYKQSLELEVSAMMQHPKLAEKKSDFVKPYFCSQNYLLLWSRCTLLRYRKGDSEYTALDAYLKQFNQSSEHLFKESIKKQRISEAQKRSSCCVCTRQNCQTKGRHLARKKC